MGDLAGAAAAVRSLLIDVPDFPSPGIVFKDVAPVLADAGALRAVVDALVELSGTDPIDRVVGIEARGFLLAAPLAYRLGAGVVLCRKPGKLPREVREVRYHLEYGSDALQVQADALTPGDRVLIVDDVLATGGTASAALTLVADCGASPAALLVLLELGGLGGRDAVAATHPDVAVRGLLST